MRYWRRNFKQVSPILILLKIISNQFLNLIYSFKKLALKHHPLKNAAHMNIHLEKFHQICEAYEVLSNRKLQEFSWFFKNQFSYPWYKNIAQWKTIYDEYGVEVLRQGIKGDDGLYYGGYVYQQNCYAIFDNYFLKNNTFYDICDKNGTEVEGSLFGSAFGGVNQPKLPPMPTIEVQVPTTLKEFYNGCIKTISYQK